MTARYSVLDPARWPCSFRDVFVHMAKLRDKGEISVRGDRAVSRREVFFRLIVLPFQVEKAWQTQSNRAGTSLECPRSFI